jgi:hypothetical protein
VRGDATADYAEHRAHRGRAGWDCSWRRGALWRSSGICPARPADMT